VEILDPRAEQESRAEHHRRRKIDSDRQIGVVNGV